MTMPRMLPLQILHKLINGNAIFHSCALACMAPAAVATAVCCGVVWMSRHTFFVLLLLSLALPAAASCYSHVTVL